MLPPGDVLSITYVNDLPAKSTETCAVNPCMDMTNLHFHGLSVSPEAPQDDVLTMLAKPGEVLHYSVEIPRDHPPGLFWYHTHPHGESHRQALDGMSGAIVIEGMERYAPEVGRLRERVIVVRGRSIEHDPNAAELMHQVEIPAKGCGGEADQVEEIFTVNGAVRPRMLRTAASRAHMACVESGSRLRSPASLDLSFHCEGGSCSLHTRSGIIRSYRQGSRHAVETNRG